MPRKGYTNITLKDDLIALIDKHKGDKTRPEYVETAIKSFINKQGVTK